MIKRTAFAFGAVASVFLLVGDHTAEGGIFRRARGHQYCYSGYSSGSYYNAPYSQAFSYGVYVPPKIGTVPYAPPTAQVQEGAYPSYQSYSYDPGAAAGTTYAAPVYVDPGYYSGGYYTGYGPDVGLPSGQGSYLDAGHKMRGRYPQ